MSKCDYEGYKLRSEARHSFPVEADFCKYHIFRYIFCLLSDIIVT